MWTGVGTSWGSVVLLLFALLLAGCASEPVLPTATVEPIQEPAATGQLTVLAVSIEPDETSDLVWVTVLVRNDSDLTLDSDRTLANGGFLLGFIEVTVLRPDGGPASLADEKFVEAEPGEEVIRLFGIDLEFGFEGSSVEVITSIEGIPGESSTIWAFEQ